MRKPVTLHDVDHDGVLGSVPADVVSVAFSGDDTHLAGVTTDNVLRVYKLDRP